METTVETQPAEKASILEVTDRCDSCGAQAYVHATLRDSGLSLLFCAHHWSVHSEKISPLVSELIDETSRLLER